MFVNNVLSVVTPITSNNINIISNGPYDLILINFYADWCHYSNHLKPVFESASNEIPLKVTGYKLLFAKVDCDAELALCRRYSVQKYPTIRVVKFGHLLKKEYRGARTIDALVEFVQNNFVNPIKEISNLNDLDDKKDGFFMGYFESKNTGDFKVYSTMSWIYNDDYGIDFYAGIGPLVEKLHPPNQGVIIFKPSKKHLLENDTAFEGNWRNIEEVKKWFMDVSKYLIREISYSNAEEIMEEKKALLLLFRIKGKHDDFESLYVDVIRNELMGIKDKVNFMLSEGKDFQHALFHLGKSLNDLPTIALDTHSHMYQFQNADDIKTPGKLLRFIEDKLANPHTHHRGHNVVIEITNVKQEVAQISSENPETKPVESVFKKLAPSKNRYTILRDEL